jgi:spore coat protein U-like protein
VTAPTLGFGSYTPGSGASLNINTTVSIACSKGTPFTIALNGGTGTVAQRVMKDGLPGDSLQYNLYTDNTYSTVFGDGSGTSKTVATTGTGMGTPVVTTVFGLLQDSGFNQANAGPSAGYTDTITVVVTY